MACLPVLIGRWGRGGGGGGGSWFPFATPVEYVFAPPSPLPTVVLLSLFHHSIPVEHSTNSMAETVETENGNRDSRDGQG